MDGIAKRTPVEGADHAGAGGGQWGAVSARRSGMITALK
jgi:hypothetical protein